jgi:hypothetical protein
VRGSSGFRVRDEGWHVAADVEPDDENGRPRRVGVTHEGDGRWLPLASLDVRSVFVREVVDGE